MTEYENLVFSCSLNYFLVANFIEQHHALDSFFLSYSHVNLFKRHWSVALVEIMESRLWVHTQKSCHVLVVRQSGAESDDADKLRSLLNLTDSTTDDGFEDRTTRVVQQMDFVDDDEFDQVYVSTFTSLSSDDVPLFGSGHNDLCFVDLLPC